ARYLSEKYAERPLDLVITLNTEALRFAIKFRYLFAPNVPIVFSCGQREMMEGAVDRPPDVTGIVIEYDITKTLELAERLQPDAPNLVLIFGASEIDRRWLEMYRTQLAPHEARFNTTYLVGLPLETM